MKSLTRILKNLITIAPPQTLSQWGGKKKNPQTAPSRGIWPIDRSNTFRKVDTIMVDTAS